jgi:hypothetical protein
MKLIKKEYTVEGIKYPNLDALAEAYKEKGVTLNSVYKRYQRGDRGDDLIPEKKRKSYIQPIEESKPWFTIGGIKYKSEADACRKLDVKYGTYKKRQRLGWTKEEAIGLETRTKAKTRLPVVELAETEEGELTTQSEGKIKIAKKGNKRKSLIAFDKTYKNVKQLADAFDMRYSLVYNRIYYSDYTPEEAVTKEKKGIKITLNGKKFSSMVEAAEYYNINVETAARRLRDNASVEQAFGLETYRTSNTVEYNGKVYPSKKALIADLGLGSSQLYRLLSRTGMSLEKAIEELQKKHPKGRRTKSFLEKNPKLGNAPACLYFARVEFEDVQPFQGNHFYKIGITSDLWERMRTLGCVKDIEFTYENTFLRVEELEAQVKDKYQHKATDKLSASHLDGFTEVFELTGAESKCLKEFISSNLQQSELN